MSIINTDSFEDTPIEIERAEQKQRKRREGKRE